MLPDQERLYAAWALVRWYGAKGLWTKAQELLSLLRGADSRYFFHRPLPLVEIDALMRLRVFDVARVRIDALLTQWPDNHDLRLARANMLADGGGCETDRLAAINEVFRSAGLRPLERREPRESLSLDNLVVGARERGGDSVPRRPLVSVLVPAFNAQATLPAALESLLSQDWPALEILVIDDASTDKTADIADGYAALDKRMRVLRRPFCEGAYAARNSGLCEARGEFITVHDADDWAHPEKIEQQVEHLVSNPDVVACTSHWVRCTDKLEFGAWRIESGWIERNISSLMFRRSVFDDLGYWDRVRAGADSEFFHRVVRAYGEHAVSDVLAGVPLSFGRTGFGSLTTSGDTHIRTAVAGVRKAYLDAAVCWHRSATDSRSLHLPDLPDARPFSIPASLSVDVREFDGRARFRSDQQNILLVAHAWLPQLFGAECCFLDLVDGFASLGANVFVAVPALGSDEHLSVLLTNAVKVSVLPYSWWQQGRELWRSAKANFRHLIGGANIDLVYANTAVLWEPLLAARACGVRTVVHVHELPETDRALCATLKAEPEAVRQHVVGLADNLVATSARVACWLDVPERTALVPNTFDPALSELPSRFGNGFHVALVSSNIPKKGLADFVEMARHILESGVSDISCLLIGPDNLHVEELKVQQAQGQVPENVRFAGFARSPTEAIAQADVVVNLSHVEEGFGRSVLEAMAGGRPVVCYEWGALPDLVIDGETGFLVPFGNPRAVAERVLELYRDSELRRGMGKAARRRAMQNFGRDVFLRKLRRGVMSSMGEKRA